MIKVAGYLQADTMNDPIEVVEEFEEEVWENADEDTRDRWMRDALMNFVDWNYREVDEDEAHRITGD